MRLFASDGLADFASTCESQRSLAGLFVLLTNLHVFRNCFNGVTYFQYSRDGTNLRCCWSSASDSDATLSLDTLKGATAGPAFTRLAGLPSDRVIHPVFVKDRKIGILVFTARKHRGWFGPDEDSILPFLTVLKNEIYIHNLFRLVVRDELTGLLNKRSFLADIKTGMHASRHGKVLSLAALDIDRFKHYNDTYGHQSGDHVLKGLGALLLRLESPHGFKAYRYGGEEIMLVFQGISASECGRRMEEIRKNVQSEDFSNQDWFIKITLSAGVADSKGIGSEAELIEHADQALYKSKKSGRNRVTVYDK
jgi:diguanylate cyclase (GGDEF)-like protein